MASERNSSSPPPAAEVESGPVRREPRRVAGRGIRPWLLTPKLLGVAVFLGGLTALACYCLLIQPPIEDVAAWVVIRRSIATIFWPCVFGGLALTLLAGLALFMQMPGIFWRQRWLKVKLIALAVLIPACHLWARSHIMAFDAALAEGRLADLPHHLRMTGWVFAISTGLFFGIVVIGRVKPRFRQKYGSRRS
jgi:hypothetical protein